MILPYEFSSPRGKRYQFLIPDDISDTPDHRNLNILITQDSITENEDNYIIDEQHMHKTDAQNYIYKNVFFDVKY
jgi:hypothetical protein